MKLPLILFGLLCAIQWYVPVAMIASQEDVARTGKVFRFKTAPVDPTDPFRGKYITLDFEAETFRTEAGDSWAYDQEVFVVLMEDANGFATIADVTATRPNDDADYVTAEVMFNGDESIRVRYPFNRFYLEESKALGAENIARRFNNDSTSQAFAVVRIKEGKSALQDVIVDGRSIVDVVREVNAAQE